MKKTLVNSLLALSILCAACGGKDDKKTETKEGETKMETKDPPVETKETAASIAAQWCDLNGKAYRAAEGAEKDAAKKVQKEFEDAMDKKYGADKTFMEEIGKEVEKCEDASEGK